MATELVGELTKYYPTEDADTKKIRTEFPREGLVRWLSVYVIGVMGAGMTFGTLYLGDNVACQAFPRDYSNYGFATSNYDKAYCANHIEAYDKMFRNDTHTFVFTKEERQQICEKAEPSRLWQNIIPSIFLLIAFANYIPSFIANTFLRDRILSYLLFIKHSVDQGYGDLERIMRFARSRREGVEVEEDETRFKELEKQCFKWQGKGLSKWYFAMNFIRLLLLIGEVLFFGLWERVRFDQIRQDFICCVDRQDPVMCTFSKYYTLLIIWLVTIGALACSVFITIKGIIFIFAEVPCDCRLCRHHTMKLCKQCSRSWCERHGDGCQECGKCRCRPDCRSHVYSRICGSRVACGTEAPEEVDNVTGLEPTTIGSEEAGTAPMDTVVIAGHDNVQLTVLDQGKAKASKSEPKMAAEGKRSCLEFPMDYHFISHLCYANCHAMKLLMIVNVMDHLAGSISDKRVKKKI